MKNFDGYIDLTKCTKYGNEDAVQRRISYSTMMMYEIADILNDAPAVDVVEVVRCKDCKHGSVEPGVYGGLGVSCWLQNKGFFPDDFCSYGEKREDA